MKIPQNIAGKPAGVGYYQNVVCTADGEVRWGSAADTLSGSLFWRFIESQYWHCFYWPIGKEGGDPIVARNWDEGPGLLPLAPSLETYTRIEYACSDVRWDDTEEQAGDH